MAQFARGISKVVTLSSAETTFGTQGAGPGQELRRLDLNMSLGVQEIASREILPTAMLRSVRQGPRQATGQLMTELSPGSYKALFQALLRGAFTAGVTTAAMTDTTLSINGTTNVITLGSAATNFLSIGFKMGDVCRLAGIIVAAGVTSQQAAAMNGTNIRCTGVTANTITFAPNPNFSAWASAQTGVTLDVVGKKLFTPETGQIYTSYTLEEWYSDVSISDLWTGLLVSQAAINIPPSGYMTANFSLAAQNMAESSVQVYPTPGALSAAAGLTAVNGKITYAGADLAYITGANLQISVDTQPAMVAGSNIAAAIFQGEIQVRGTLSCLLTSDTLTTDFLSENVVSLELYGTTSPANGADFMSFFLPQVKLFGGPKQDSPTAITRSFNFVATENVAGGAGTEFDQTVIVMQDSLA